MHQHFIDITDIIEKLLKNMLDSSYYLQSFQIILNEIIKSHIIYKTCTINNTRSFISSVISLKAWFIGWIQFTVVFFLSKSFADWWNNIGTSVRSWTCPLAVRLIILWKTRNASYPNNAVNPFNIFFVLHKSLFSDGTQWFCCGNLSLLYCCTPHPWFTLYPFQKRRHSNTHSRPIHFPPPPFYGLSGRQLPSFCQRQHNPSPFLQMMWYNKEDESHYRSRYSHLTEGGSHD